MLGVSPIKESALSLPRLVLALAVAAASLPAQVRIPIQKKVLPNGLTVMLVERHNAPIFSARFAFKAGSANDPFGASGVAHVVEHMLFKGTTSYGLKQAGDYAKEQAFLQREDALWDAIVVETRALEEASRRQVYATGKPGPESSPKLEQLKKDFEAVQAEHRALVAQNDYGALYEAVGGTGINAGTAMDFTFYQVSLPKNRFEFWCRMESDRLANPVLREFYTERDVIKEERRMTLEDGTGGRGPMGVLVEPFQAAAFPYQPYGRTGIGPMSDLFNLKRSEVQAFLTKYYAPNRAALVLVGDLKMEEILPSIEAYFGKMARQEEPAPVHTVAPAQNGERRISVEKDMTPMVRVGWHVPAVGHPDVPALNVLCEILSGGRTSRLYKRAVEGQELTTGFGVGYGDPGSKYPTLVTASATVKGEHTTQELEACLYDELEKLKKDGPTQAEVTRVIRNAEMGVVKKLEDSDSLATELAVTWSITGDETAFLADLDRTKAVTPADVQRVAKAYFTPQNRVVATLVRPANAGAKDPVDAQIEALLAKAIATQVSDAAQAKAILDQQMGQIKALPKEKKAMLLQQLQAQFGGK